MNRAYFRVDGRGNPADSGDYGSNESEDSGDCQPFCV